MLTALVPVYNEESSITCFLEKLKGQVDYIVVINDGSKDKTADLILSWLENNKSADFISLEKNKGMSGALLQGFKIIEEKFKNGQYRADDIVVTIDADGQHDPLAIKEMKAYFLENKLDLLIAKRVFSGYPLYRVIGNKFMTGVNSILGGFCFRDIESGFKMMSVGFILDLLKYYQGFRYSCAGEIGIIAGLLKKRIDNNFAVMVPYYRKEKKGPGISDVFINILFSLLAVFKVKFSSKDKRLKLPGSL